MADLVVGLAKSVVDGALTKAHSAIEEEAKLRTSAQRDLVFITGEFEMMQSFLNVANEERVDNKVVKTWVRQIRELAYDVEDCIELVVHLDKKTRIWGYIRRICLPCIPQPLDQAVDEIEQLKARVQDVSTRNARYNLISDTGTKPVVVQQPPPVGGATTASTMLAEARDATMRQQESGDLSRLVTNKDGDLGVISVWGSDGDHGITSIIRKTYSDPEICENFACRAWIKLTHPFNPREFVLGLMSQFYTTGIRDRDEDGIRGIQVIARMEATQEDVFNEFQKVISEARYLVVLEDLPNMVEWDAVRAFLPDRKNGSWIIVSTQEAEIASLCIGHSYQILELKRFSAEHSVCALFKEISQVSGDKGKEPMGSGLSQFSSYTKMLSRKEGAEDWRENFSLVVHGSQMTELHKYIAKARFSSSHVMSVWGLPGVGKSALVKKVYDDITIARDRRFEMWHWVVVSKPFILRDFCRSMLSDSHSPKDPIEACRALLAQPCLIVIDDLQSTEEWDLIQDALLSTRSKSVIIVITTEATIARHCCTDNEELMFNVKGLEADAAIDFLKKEVQRKKPYSPLLIHGGNMEEVEELILKCGGLPKVIAAVAGLLATQRVTLMDGVRSLNLRFIHHLETKAEMYNLRDLFSWMHSYFSTCPDFLKPCIFYLSIFPRGQAIRRRRLVRRWIAEGYSRDGHNESAEENGEKHFSELLELSIVQHVTQLLANQFSDTRQVLCQVNGFMREYIVSQRMGENLVFELGGKCALTTQRTGRHLIILQDWDRDKIVFETTDFSRLRSLTVFGHWKSFFICENMKMLRVLDLENASGVGDEDLVEMVKCLRRLKFLSLRRCHGIFHLPGSLSDLRQLQTLDVRGTSILTLPESITKLKKLQYIRAGTTNDILVPTSTRHVPLSRRFSRIRHRRVGVEVARRIGKLTMLHTLGVVNVVASGGKALLEEIKKLTQLRKLGVSGVNMKNNKDFVSAISGHVHLESLSVHLEGCLDDISLPCENLQSLKLYGLQHKLPLPRSDLSKLSKLALEMDTLENDAMEILANLPEVRIIYLRVKQPGKIHFHAEMSGEELHSFEKVKILEIACSSDSLHVTFGSKSMKNLELLKIDCSGASYTLTGLDDLRLLKTVFLKGTNDETLRTYYESQLVNHPTTPAVKLEGVSSSS